MSSEIVTFSALPLRHKAATTSPEQHDVAEAGGHTFHALTIGLVVGWGLSTAGLLVGLGISAWWWAL